MSIELFDALGAPCKPPTPGGTKILLNNMQLNVSDASQRTYEFVGELDTTPDETGQVGFDFGQAGADMPAMSASAMMIGALSDLDSNNFASAVAITFDEGASSSATFQRPQGTTQVALTRSDLMTLPKVARTDGGTKALVAVRTFMTASNGFWNGKTGETIADWATRTSGLLRTRRNTSTGDQRTATGNWAASDITPFVGFEFSSEKPVLDVAVFGDSQDYGSDTYRGAGPAVVACDLLNAELAGEMYVSCSNRAWPGQNASHIVQHVQDYFAHGFRPHIVILPWRPQNSVASGYTQTDDDALEAMFWKAAAIAQQYGSVVIARAMLPAPNGSFAWGSSGDAIRLAANAAGAISCPAAGIPFIAVRPEFVGSTVGNGGQQSLAAPYTDDFTHLNDVGIDLWAPDYVTAIRQAARGRLP